MLNILKIYVERKESLSKSEEIISGLLKSGETQKDLIEHIKIQKRVKRDSSNERASDFRGNSLRQSIPKAFLPTKKAIDAQVDSFSSMSDFLKSA